METVLLLPFCLRTTSPRGVLRSLLVSLFFFYRLCVNAREDSDHVICLFLAHLPDDRISASDLNSLNLFLCL